jgi:hypothetical protein
MPRLGWAICIVFTGYLLMPSQMYGGSGVDHRLPIAWFLLLIASSAPRFPSRRVATAVAIVAGSMLVIRLVVIEHVWRQADEIYSADLIGIDALPRGIKLAVAIPPNAHTRFQSRGASLRTGDFTARSLRADPLAHPGQQPIALQPSPRLPMRRRRSFSGLA